MEKNLNTPPTQLYNIHYDMKTLFDSLPYTKSFAKGEIIYHQGDIADSFYYIKKGKATVFMISPDGMEKTLNTASKGELIGEGAFFDHKPRVSSAKAVTASELTIIDKKILLDLIQKNPPIAFELLEILPKDFEENLDKLLKEKPTEKIMEVIADMVKNLKEII